MWMCISVLLSPLGMPLGSSTAHRGLGSWQARRRQFCFLRLGMAYPLSIVHFITQCTVRSYMASSTLMDSLASSTLERAE